MTELAIGVSPRLAGVNRHCLRASIADSSSISYPLLRSISTAALSPSSETCTFSITVPCQPMLLAREG